MKMEYGEFKEMLKTVLEKHFEGVADVSITILQRINHVDEESIVIREKGKDVFKTISLERVYQIYFAVGDFDRCAEVIMNLCGEELTVTRKDLPRSWEEAKGKVHMRLVKKEWNREMLEETPHRDYLDFAVVFCILVAQTEEMNAVTTINKEMAEAWKVNEDHLWEAAWENLKKEQFALEDMDTILREELGMDLTEIEEANCQWGFELYVMSNQNRSYGARAVLRKDLLQKFAEEQKSSFYLLPSSIHEWILCRDNGELDSEELKRTVCEINGNACVISPEECLSDSIYYYDLEKDEVRIVA